MTEVGIGDVLAVRTNGKVFERLIRWGAKLRGASYKASQINHIIIPHHYDKQGVLWGIEGRPGGVGYYPVQPYLDSPYTVDNREQPKTEGDRFVIAKAAEGLLGTPYDWQGIVADGMIDIGAQALWAQKWGSEKVPPAHVVCSSFADWLYDYRGLASPGKKFDQHVQPYEWADFSLQKAWLK